MSYAGVFVGERGGGGRGDFDLWPLVTQKKIFSNIVIIYHFEGNEELIKLLKRNISFIPIVFAISSKISWSRLDEI